MPRSLVTGATGFMGSHMVDFLIDQGHDVVATDLEKADRAFLNPKADFRPSDLTRSESLDGLCKDIDYLFHVAALFSYSARFIDLYRANATGTRELFRRALKETDRLKSVVLWGAAGLYGMFKNPPVKESDEPDPQNDYIKSKFAQEDIALDFYKEHGLPVTVMRLVSPYGPRQRYGTYTTLQMIAKGQVLPLLISTAGNRVQGFMHVSDVSRLGWFLAERPEQTSGEIYNASDETSYTQGELTHFLGDALGTPFFDWPRIPVDMMIKSAVDMEAKFRAKGKKSPVDADMAKYAALDVALDTSKLQALGFKCEVPDCRDGILQTIDWYRKEGWLPPLED